ncbi:family 16 glycosylhydrolase [Cellulophaga sp. E16_2]|uniref:family 16 glycosylhydrolase n=1 Tax=Cellulophaga sp. E16_2 TaxID=2789297 RepID=UPI001A91991F|nr:family 16 glycosylhydrolase [Cellulophaga sp. E16_2]MBO0590272.1 family 16 glycosylhydrolase [Cellulophaga sp. E16_2]
MKNIKYYIGIFLVLGLVFTSCQEDEAILGDFTLPSNVASTSEIVGVDTDNPYGDGSGFVNFTATADNEISYRYDFGDGKSAIAPTGEYTHRYTTEGINTYAVVVSAIGSGGILSSTTYNITVYSSFKDEEALDFMAGTVVGSNKTWYWAANIPLHVGLGPVEDDYGNGEFAYEAWWNAIQAWDEEKSCMYTNEFVFTRLEEGVTFEQTVGPAFIPGTYSDVLGVDGDMCYDETVVTTMFGVKDVTLLPSSSKAALEGTYNDEAYRSTSFEIADGGFMGWYVGASTYDIISVTDDTLIVRIIQAGNGFAWYHKFTSVKPVEGVVAEFESEFNTLFWSDEFDIAGAPDALSWTYDLGAGGWGNGESQNYTNNLENAIVEDGSLKITAKADGVGGYTSARLKSQGLFDFKYGRVEVRAKLPAAQGTWPAIWLLGSNIEDVNWPACGEIDVMEQTGWDKTITSAALHFPGNSGGDAPTNSIDNETSTTEFHNYVVDWTADEINILVDDEVFFTQANSSDSVFNLDFFLILNVAMGGTLGGDIDPAFTEDTMEIDYVRVYQ